MLHHVFPATECVGLDVVKDIVKCSGPIVSCADASGIFQKLFADDDFVGFRLGDDNPDGSCFRSRVERFHYEHQREGQGCRQIQGGGIITHLFVRIDMFRIDYIRK